MPHKVDENLLRAKLPLPLTHEYGPRNKNDFIALRNFLQENMVTKRELKELRAELPRRL
jgi:hypothetical protein